MNRVQAVNRLLYRGKGHKQNRQMVKRQPTKVVVKGVSVQHVNFKPPTGDSVSVLSVKDKQEWMYPGGVVQRAPSVKLGSKNYYDHKDVGMPRRKHESNFFITLNTNRSTRSHLATGPEVHEAKMAMKSALHLLSQDEAMAQYLKFGPKNENYRDDCFDDVIESAEWSAAVEIGEKQERLHAHIWLTLHHYSQVQINMPVMQQMFKAMYNNAAPSRMAVMTGLPYIQVKLLPTANWAQVMKQYIRKGMQDFQVPGTVDA